MYLVKCSNFPLKSETRDECRSYCPANRARLGRAKLSPMGCYQTSPQVEPSEAPCLLTAHSPRRLGRFFLEPPDRTDQSNYRIYFFAVSRLRISSQPKRARTLARPVHSSGDEAVFLG